MKLAHVHVGVADLDGAVQWFGDIWGRTPSLQTPGMACYPLGEAMLVLDLAESDVPVTIAVKSQDCDGAHAELVQRGAESLSAPSSKAWGVRSAYLRGPGKLVLELEQDL